MNPKYIPFEMIMNLKVLFHFFLTADSLLIFDKSG